MDKIEKAMQRAARERQAGTARGAGEEPALADDESQRRTASEAGAGNLADRIAGAQQSAREGPDRDASYRGSGDDAAWSEPDDGPEEDLIKPEFRYTQSRVSSVDPRTLEAHRIISDRSPARVVNAYKMLRTQVLQRLERHDMSTIAVVSARDDDGRTLTAVNLGLSIARDTQHTALVVDLDLRAPGIHRLFGLQPEKGIEDHLFQGVPMPSVLLNPGIQRFMLLPTCRPVADSSELLASRRVGELVGELKMRYDSRIVIFDLPPLLEYDDALAFLPHVDAVLLVASNGRTRKADLTRTLDLLGDKPIVGTVLNRADAF